MWLQYWSFSFICSPDSGTRFEVMSCRLFIFKVHDCILMRVRLFPSGLEDTYYVDSVMLLLFYCWTQAEWFFNAAFAHFPFWWPYQWSIPGYGRNDWHLLYKVSIHESNLSTKVKRDRKRWWHERERRKKYEIPATQTVGTSALLSASVLFITLEELLNSVRDQR